MGRRDTVAAKPPMKCLFLDFDGCLNSADYTRNRRSIPRPTPHRIDAQAVPHLNTVLKRTGAKVVISSNCRHGHTAEGLQVILRTHGVECEVIGVTPAFTKNFSRHPEDDTRVSVAVPRGKEIQAWLAEHPEVVRFAILDDKDDMCELMPYLVQTDFEYGLTAEHVEPLVKLLGEAVPVAENGDCPDCGHAIVSLWGGVKCSNCEWWYCV